MLIWAKTNIIVEPNLPALNRILSSVAVIEADGVSRLSVI
jgi:hypothetical protein